ncbi:MAG: hypothetical protein SH808_01095 [Saprospiraceae bacterium]|nr:hypothetical protein [Saprospiraceae bacterium]
MFKKTYSTNLPTVYDRPYRQCIAVYALFFLGFQIMSCMPAVKLIYGLHQPRYVSDAAVVKYGHRLGWQSAIYRVNNYNDETRTQYRYLGSSMPDVLLFNSTGQLTKFEMNCSNDLKSLVTLSSLQIDSLPTSEKSIRDFMEDTYVLSDSGLKNLIQNEEPLYVVKFAEFAGLLNKDNVPDLVEKLSSRKDVQFVVLNMDYTILQ